MRNRLTKFLTAFALVAALAVGGAAIASATHTSSQKQQAKIVKKSAAKPSSAVKRSLTASEPAEAADSESAAETPDTPEAASTPESAADTAAQDAACKAAGISPTADNVNFDDASGTCTLDNGNN
jgi:cytoskeletal protein RodZ